MEMQVTARRGRGHSRARSGSDGRTMWDVRGMRSRAVWAMCLLVVVGALVGGCSSTREVTKSPRGAIEQLLLSQSVERSLTHLSLSHFQGASVVLEAEGIAPDMAIIKALLREELGRQGIIVVDKRDEANVVIKVTVHSIGTEQAETFFGMPEVAAGFLPISIPELAIYKANRQKGHARFSLAVVDRATGKVLETVPWRAGSAYYNYFVVLLFISFPATDLVLPPVPGGEDGETFIGLPESIFRDDYQERASQRSPGSL